MSAQHPTSGLPAPLGMPRDVETVQPAPFDVLLGRGRAHQGHPGNRRLQMLVNMYREQYSATNSRRSEKTRITEAIVNQIKCCGTERGRFLEHDPFIGGWVEIKDEDARLRISQKLRYKGTTTSQKVPVREEHQLQAAAAAPNAEGDSEELLLSDESILSHIGYPMGIIDAKGAVREQSHHHC